MEQEYNVFTKALIKLLQFVKYTFIDSIVKFFTLIFAVMVAGVKWVIKVEPPKEDK